MEPEKREFENRMDLLKAMADRTDALRGIRTDLKTIGSYIWMVGIIIAITGLGIVFALISR